MELARAAADNAPDDPFVRRVLGWALAVGIYEAAAWVINNMMAAQLEAGQQVCRVLPLHYGVALGLTCGAAVVASGLAGLRSARVEPSEGLREL